MLEAELQPIRKGVAGWTVGRLHSCDIAFNVARNPEYAMVSKRHAVIRAEPRQDTTEGGGQLWQWSVIDHGEYIGGKPGGSTNGTYLSSNNAAPYRLQPGVPYGLNEGDRLQFGCQAALLRVSFDTDDTVSPGYEVDDTDPPTGSVARTAVGEAVAKGLSWADVAVIVLNGPVGVPSPLWWGLLAALTVLLLWLWQD